MVVTERDHSDLGESLAALRAAPRNGSGNDTRLLHVSAEDVSGDEPVLVVGDVAWLRRALRGPATHGA